METNIILIFFVVAFIFTGVASLIKWYKKPIPGQAIIRTGSGGIKIAITDGIFVIPTVHSFDYINLTTQRIEIAPTTTGILSRDKKEIAVQVSFYVRVNATIEDIKRVATAFGCKRTFDKEEITDYFKPKFAEALRIIICKYDASELIMMEEIREQIFQFIGKDLNGYFLDDISIDKLEAKRKRMSKLEFQKEGVKL